MKQCKGCGRTNPSNQRYCAACGDPLFDTCPHCGTHLPDTAHFCPTCGAAVGRRAGLLETRRLVTILFADIVGSTPTIEKLDAEDARDLLGNFFSLMAGEIHARGGHVRAYLGDAIMALFGVPAAHDDDPMRAVETAVGMITRLEKWREEQPEMPLQIRIGINTGEVVVGKDPGQDLPLTADAVNVAARLEQLAAPGTILLGRRTARAVEDKVLLRPLGPQRIKGKSEPFDVWQVLKTRPSAFPAARPRAPMVGRRRELSVLRRALDETVKDRHARLVTLLGDPGVGKSRLLDEFADSLAGKCRVVFGRCPGYRAGGTLAPLADILRAESGVLIEDDLEVALGKVQKLAESIVRNDDSSRVSAGLTTTLGLEHPLGATGNAREVHEHLLFAWSALFSALASDRSLVVIVEDLHWADALLLEVLEDVAVRVNSPVLIVCSARPDFKNGHPDWPAAERGSSLTLESLQADETAALLDHLLGATLAQTLRQRILQRAEGNPFFVEQITRRLIEHAADAGKELDGLTEVAIPDDVHSVILSRLDLLPAETSRVLQEAAVIGREFREPTLTALSDEEDLTPHLEELVARELLVRSGEPDESEYVFKHALVRDVAYETLPRRVRATMHERVARWLQRVSGARATEYVEVVAHHFHRTFEITQDEVVQVEARAAYVAAARKAQRRFAIQDAGRFGQTAVELSPRGLKRVESLEELGDVYYMASEGDSAWTSFCDALAELDRTGKHSDVEARVAAKAAVLATRFAGALQHEASQNDVMDLIARGLAAAGPGDSAERCALVMSRAALQIAHYEHFSSDAADVAGEAVEIAERLDDPDLISASLDIAAGLFIVEGRFREMQPLQERRMALEARLTDPRELGDALGMAAWAAHNAGDFSAAETYASRGLDVARGQDAGMYAHALAWRICARFTLGRWGGVFEDQQELDLLQEEADRDLPVPYALRGYAATALSRLLRGERDESERYVSILESARTHNVPRGAFEPTLARLHAHLGEHDKAFTLIAVETGGHSGCPDEVRAARLEALCDLILLAERWDMADDTLLEARSEAERVKSASLPAFADRLEGAAAFTRHDSAVGNRLLRRSFATFDALGARWHSAYSRLWLARLTSEERAPDSELMIAEAFRTFEELGSVAELADARSLAPGSASRAT